MRKTSVIAAAAVILAITTGFSAYADIISNTPFSVAESAQMTAETTADITTDSYRISSVPEALAETAAAAETPAAVTEASAAAETPSPTEAGSGTQAVTGISEIVPVPNAASSAAPVSYAAPAAPSAAAGTGKTRLSLNTTLISPAVQQGNLTVAEGSVQLSDGSWAEIPHSKNIRARYFRLLREQLDSTGVSWYIVAANATRIGDFSTPDGSRITELWLKKSDCTSQSYIDVDTDNTVRQNIVREALSHLGQAYHSAGNGPDAFDCSGFVKYVMSTVGISVPRTSTELCYCGTEVGRNGLRPGDIVGRPGHVGIYIGDGQFVHASESATGVITESLDIYNTVRSFTSYVNVVGD